jgi:hypothetical protein
MFEQLMLRLATILLCNRMPAMAKSNASLDQGKGAREKRAKPAKPSPDFPLFPHDTKR